MGVPSGEGTAVEPDFSRPHTARVYDYYLGGKDNYLADREAGDAVLAAWPGARTAARVNRDFMHRAVRHLAAEEGIRQFLDIGTGIPTEPNLHQIAQACAPECRVVYVDKDPLVLTHAKALMRSAPEGRTACVHADVTDGPDRILNAPELTDVLDFSRPVALSLLALLHFVPDEQGAYGIVRHLLDALPAGSALVLSHGTGDFDAATMERVAQVYRRGGNAAQSRSRAEVARFFDGLELLSPGIEVPHRWRLSEPGPELTRVGTQGVPEATEVTDAAVGMWAAVGLKTSPAA
ncbi:SAM-dependent methyltransferase [Streptomyces sp. MP131-18]|uniref:SAM-dependent methyltransferase n=1 Tax=Streptomyces sp. MP131-18 TaxID=1857892 RepID=UPI00097C91D7|nr:SAM-dependent methyltransferase [Streptomyces sp. MP131-18]ONK13431.1 S-adenosyl methyltransferase [Streptomyces sp. MP131-18]